MLILDADHIKGLLDWPGTIAALERMFTQPCTIPERLHYTLAPEGQQQATLLLMPAWVDGKYSGVKMVNIYPGNSAKDLPTILGIYLLMDGATGELLGIFEGTQDVGSEYQQNTRLNAENNLRALFDVWGMRMRKVMDDSRN